MSQPPAYIQKATFKRYGHHYWIKVVSPLTGKMLRVPKAVTGHLPTEEAARAWLDSEQMAAWWAVETRRVERQEWRNAAEIVKLANQYTEFRKTERPRSWRQEVSALLNFVLPYFVTVAGVRDPNKWWQEHQRFKAWLKGSALTQAGKPLTLSSANKAINALNQFCEWLRDHVRALDWENFRPLSSYPAHVAKNKKGASELVDIDEFNLVKEALGEGLWQDMWAVQRHTGMRLGEMMGLSLASLLPTKRVPQEIQSVFLAAKAPPGLNRHCYQIEAAQIFGGIYLESQVAQEYVKRENGEIPRSPLKWRREISPRYARTIPIYVKEVWNILSSRYQAQLEMWKKLQYGPKKESYLLFEGAQKLAYANALQAAYLKVGLRYKGSHALRHTRATELEFIQMPDVINEIVMGHKAQAREDYRHLKELLNQQIQSDLEMDDIVPVT